MYQEGHLLMLFNTVQRFELMSLFRLMVIAFMNFRLTLCQKMVMQGYMVYSTAMI